MSKKDVPKVAVPPKVRPANAPTDRRPFTQGWINSCFQDTLLPNAPWHKLEEEVAHNLAQKAERQFSHPQRKEMLLEILGQHFVEKFLSHVQPNPELLGPIHMTADERNRLKIDAQNWLNSQMYKAVKETGHNYLLTGIGPGDPPPTGAYAEFLQHTFTTFTTGLERELYKQEKVLTKAKADELNFMKKMGNQADIYKVPAPSRIKPVGTASSGSSVSTAKPGTRQLKTMVHTVEGDPPPLWGAQSDTIGAAVASVLQRDPRKLELVAGRLHGRQLPGTLRSYVWADVLFKAERTKMKEVFVEKVVRERFALAVTRGLMELRIKTPTQSPINGLIQNAVIEIYGKVTSMVPYKQMQHMKESIRALNVLYVYDRSYEPYLIHWLFPMQLGFRNKQAMSEDKGEHVLELAMYLDMLNTHCFPSWPQVFAMAEQVMTLLQQQDPELYNHLKRIAPINAQVNPKEFMVQLLHHEREKGESMMKTSTNTPRAPSSSTQFLADPTIFLRRWIGEGFVSVLDTPGVMYIWDQLFMQSWKQSAIINTCLGLMELLRHHFMEAYDYLTMKEVFLMEPCKLYTVDFQMAWIHVENGKNILDIGDLYNRQRPQSPASRMSDAPLSGRASPPIGILPPCGVKNMRASISIPSEAVQKEPWLATMQARDIGLYVGVFFGSIKMKSRSSETVPVVTSASKDSYGGLSIQLEFPGERYIYDMLDLSQYDVERELGAYPYAILVVESLQRKETMRAADPVALGWARVPLYRQERRRGEQTFALIEGDVTVSLHPGEVPDSFITTLPQTPSSEGRNVEGSLIGYNCTLSTHVFDPNNEPPDRPAIPQYLSPSPSIPPQVPPINTQATPPPQPPTPRQPPTPAQPEPEPEPEPTPPPPSESPDGDPNPWEPFKPAAAKTNPKPTTNREPFMLYIDAVHHIPDNASIIKVTGRILRAGNVTNLQDILAVPTLDGRARSPSFDFSMAVNEGRQVADTELLLFLRVYTVDVVTEKLVVVGSCLVGVFGPGKKKGEGLLRVGGHQIRLRSGMPDMKGGLNQISATDLDSNPVIPGCSLLIRLLPLSQNPAPAPKYSTGYYQSNECKPSPSESRIFNSYSDFMTYPKTERDMIKRLQQSERKLNLRATDAELLDWLQNRLDLKKQMSANQPANNLSLMRCVRYRIKMGLKVHIEAAYGLPDGLFIQAFARIMPGNQAKFMSRTDDGYGGEEKFFTNHVSPTCRLTAPVWEDPPVEVHPFYDANTCIIIKLIGLDVLYRPRPDHKSPGTLHKVDGSPLELTNSSFIGWTVAPLFDGNSVISAIHTLPIFTCPLTEDILDDLVENIPSTILSRRIWGVHNKMVGASVQMSVWDAHFDLEEAPEIVASKALCDVVGETRQEEIQRAAPASITIQERIMAMLEEKVRKQGPKGTTFKKEVVFFDAAMKRCFDNLMGKYFEENGMAPL